MKTDVMSHDIIRLNAALVSRDPNRDDQLTCVDPAYIAAIMVYVTHIRGMGSPLCLATPVSVATEISDGVFAGTWMINLHLDMIMNIRAGMTFMAASDDDRDETIMDIAYVSDAMA